MQAVLARLRGEHLDVMSQQRELACDISCRLAELAAASRKFQSAHAHYKAALVIQSDYKAAIVQSAKLHLAAGELESCQQQVCAKIKS